MSGYTTSLGSNNDGLYNCNVYVYFYIFVDPNTNCRTELSEIEGYIRPPDSNKDGLYDYNLNCWWTLMAGEFQAINLKVQNIDIDGVRDCEADRLEVSNFIRSINNTSI